MIHGITARNVNDALNIGLSLFQGSDVREVRPRGERRLELPDPFVTTYMHPEERVLFSTARDANPFFHVMDSLWMLAGRDDTRWLGQWLPSITNYSDDGQHFYGAYGNRLMHHGQLDAVINRLRDEKDTTRAVLALYQSYDCRYTGKDMPCNTTIYLQLRDGVLDITVCNRSNDLIWGAYGANAVQFSMLQEYIAGHVRAKMGTYNQFSNNTHIYPDNEATKRCIDDLKKNGYSTWNPYDERNEDDKVDPYPLMQDPIEWGYDLEEFMAAYTDESHFYHHVASIPFREPFFEKVIKPMTLAHIMWRQRSLTAAMGHAACIAATDWRAACMAWLQRRIDRVKT